MLSRFIESQGYKRVVLTANLFEINLSGDLRNVCTKTSVKLMPNNNGEPIIIEQPNEWFNGFKLAVVMGIVFRNVVSHHSVWSLLDVLYKDDNPRNFSVRNTVWKCPEGKWALGYTHGFTYIPGFSRYMIDPAGNVYSALRGGNLTPYQDSAGYWMFGVQPDVGKRTIVGQHRLLGLAFKPYPANVDKLDINHLDGKTFHNDLPNLEWTTRTRNNIHAIEIGLTKTAVKVRVRNSITKEVVEYFSLEECARQLKLNGETIRQRAFSNGTKFYESPTGIYQFKLANDNKPWIEYDNPLARFVRYRIPIEVTNSDGNISVHSNMDDVSKVVGISRSGVLWRLNNHPGEFVDGYKIQYLNDGLCEKSPHLEINE